MGKCEDISVSIPTNLHLLHLGEETLRQKANELSAKNSSIQLHLTVTEAAMDLADLLRQHGGSTEDQKVLVLLSMRCFNAFASSIKLAMSGYFQNSAMILRDVLETVFLIDLFTDSPDLIEHWRFADKKKLKEEFSPAAVRKILDCRDGFTGKKREEAYKLFSELASHPTMKSAWMLRPQKDGDAHIGPFMEETILLAVLFEMGKLAIQVGELVDRHFPAGLEEVKPARLRCAEAKSRWIKAFYKIGEGKRDAPVL